MPVGTVVSELIEGRQLKYFPLCLQDREMLVLRFIPSNSLLPCNLAVSLLGVVLHCWKVSDGTAEF